MAKITINSIDSFEQNTTQNMIAKKRIENEMIIFNYNNKYGV